MASPAALDDARHVADMVARSGTSFFWSMRLLPRGQRGAMFAVYAYCRAIDDIADGDQSPAEKRAALAGWRTEIDRAIAGVPTSAIGRALAPAIREFDLDRADFLALIDGMEMDATAIIAPDWPTLRLYCARVAGAVGLLSVRVFGIPDPTGRALAESLGEAVQLTNILRDIDEDAALGRLYLPRECLLAAGLPLDPRAVSDPRLAVVCAEVAATARARFDEAARLIATQPRSRVRTPRIIHAVYARLLDRLEARGFAPPRAPARLSKLAKLSIALRHVF